MPTPSDRAAGIYVKVERAKEHVRDLETLVQGFLQSNPYEIVVQDEPDTGDRVFRVKVNSEPPLKWSAIIGDAIHNLRAALDLLVCELVRGEGNPVTVETGFPIFKSAKAFKSGFSGKVKGAPKEAIDLIKRAKPYKGGNEPLWWLHRLDIADKHRVLITVGSAYHSFILDAARAFDDFPDLPPELVIPQDVTIPIAIKPADRQWPLKDGAIVFKVSRESRSKMDENTQFAFEVAFGEGEVVQGEPLIPTLHQLVEFVEGLMEPFLPLLRDNG
jgi:hypothetical protein